VSRGIVACLLSTIMVMAQATAGQDSNVPAQPPVRLKKKAKPVDQAPPKTAPAEEKKTEPQRDPADREPGDSPEEKTASDEQNEQQILDRVGKNMRGAEDHLGQNDPGAETRRLQAEALKDLDDLIKQAQQTPPESPQQDQQQSGKRQNASQQQDSRQQRASAAKPGGQTKNQPSATANAAGLPPARGGIGKERLGKIADLYKDVWGHLPETLRMEMDQYSREQFMPKYSDLLKQYYTTIAENGRKKDGR
jgi:hypothetical protein